MDEVLSGISSHELSEWMAFEKVFPFGEIREDYRTALVAMNIAAPNSKHKLKDEDFLLFKMLDKGYEVQENKDIERLIMCIPGIKKVK